MKNHQYRVILRFSISDPILATSGVPQVSHLGPLIFVLTINDVINVITESTVSIYADDMKIIKVISTPSDSSLLQNDLNSFQTWCDKNFLELNVTKCQSITFSRKRVLLPSRTYCFHEATIPIVSSIRDLGVICDSQLNFRPHFDHIINRANSSLGFVKRWSKEFSNPYVTKSLYITFVRPLLEYASQVWSPYQNSHSQRIEAVQRRFLRFALRGLPWSDNLILPPYEDRLKLINLQTLQKRREVADILFLHQLLAGTIDSSFLVETIPIYTNPRHVRSAPLFRLPRHRTNYGLFEPISRMLRLANNAQDTFDFHISSSSLRSSLYNSS